MSQSKTKAVPRNAMQLISGPCRFAEGEEMADGHFELQGVARTGDAIDHWWWGPIVHDFAGMRVGDRAILDWCHDEDEIIGFVDEFDSSSGDLVIGAEMVQFAEGDRAAEIAHKGRAGVPYQLSIDWTGPSVVEELSVGMSATVNGRTVQGPATIVRQWHLRGVAVCPYGADHNTSTQFSADDSVEVTILGTEENEQMADETQGGSGDQNATDAVASVRQELQRFTARFGSENGVAWFNEQLTFEQGLERHCDALAQQLAAAQAEIDDLKTKLAAVEIGETEPVDTAPQKETVRLRDLVAPKK